MSGEVGVSSAVLFIETERMQAIVSESGLTSALDDDAVRREFREFNKR